MIREDDNLVLIGERTLTSPENPGYVIYADQSHPSWTTRWESTVEWDNNSAAGASVWRDLIRKNRSVIRSDVAIEIGRGHFVLNLVQDEALLTLQSGYLRSLTAGMNITLNADDMEFLSGVGRVVGLASLTLRTHKNVSSYYIGTAAAAIVGQPFTAGSPRHIATH